MVAQTKAVEVETNPKSQATPAPAKPKLVIVELAKSRSVKQIKRLRKGKGKLVDDIDDVLTELTNAGTMSGNSQPIVLVVRETPPLPWPLNTGYIQRVYEDVEDDDDD